MRLGEISQDIHENLFQSAEGARFHRCSRLVSNFTIGEVGKCRLVARIGIGNIGWLVNKETEFFLGYT